MRTLVLFGGYRELAGTLGDYRSVSKPSSFEQNVDRGINFIGLFKQGNLFMHQRFITRG
jgi:hypothetical protein